MTTFREFMGSVFYFGSYSYSKQKLEEKYGDTNWGILLAGGIGGLFGWFGCYPFDIVKTKLQAEMIGE